MTPLFHVFLDSDGPIADFDKAHQKSGKTTAEFKMLPGTYLWLEETPGAREAISILKCYDDNGIVKVWVATKTPAHCPYAYTEKVLWYRQHFPWLEDRVILTHDKSLLGTLNDVLVDDRPKKANAEFFRGSLVVFDTTNPVQSWSKFKHVVNQKIHLADPNIFVLV